jgi:hypothetical protein
MKGRCKRNCGGILFALGVALLGGSCSTAPEVPHSPQHVVLLWLKHPERAADRAQLLHASRPLRFIPGVLQVETGRTAPGAQTRDQGFDLAVVITFRDAAALQRYEADPRRLAAMARYLGPLVRRYEVYDLGVR